MDKRGLKRFRVRFPIGLVGDVLDGKGELLDLSTGGCRIQGGSYLKSVPYLGLILHVPHIPMPVKVELAAVRWVSGAECGMEFIRVNSHQQEHLRQLIRLLEMVPTAGQCGRGTDPALQGA